MHQAFPNTFQDQKCGDQLLQLVSHIKSPGTLGRLYLAIGSFYFSQDDFEKAEHYYQHEVEILSTAQLTGCNSIALTSLGGLAEERGDYDTAIVYHYRALDEAQAVGHVTSMRLANVARLLLKADDKQAAHNYLHQMVDEAATIEYVHLFAFLWLADYLKDDNLSEAAVQIVAHVDKHRHMHKRLPLAFGEDLSATLKEKLGAEAFAQLWKQGLNLSLADMVSLAHEALNQVL